MLARYIFVSASITNLPSPANMKFEDALPKKNLPKSVPWEFHTWVSVSTSDYNERTMKKIGMSQKKPTCYERGRYPEEKKKDRMEDRKKKLSPVHHLHNLHIHSHFYRSVSHLGCLHQHMRIRVYLRKLGYRDPHRMRICSFHKGARGSEEGDVVRFK